jgi:hypothetical protein
MAPRPRRIQLSNARLIEGDLRSAVDIEPRSLVKANVRVERVALFDSKRNTVNLPENNHFAATDLSISAAIPKAILAMRRHDEYVVSGGNDHHFAFTGTAIISKVTECPTGPTPTTIAFEADGGRVGS